MKNTERFHSLKYVVIFFLCFVLVGVSNAQNPDFLEHNWYFGNSPYGIIFSKGNNSADSVSNQNTSAGYALGGGAVATDQQSGELLFYTDGSNVFDNSHQIMPNGTGINHNTNGNQHTAILPVPGQEDQYYIITNTANLGAAGSIIYSIVDMSLDGNGGVPQPSRGEVTTKNVNTGIPTGEAMISFYTGNDPYQYFILVQEPGTRNFTVYEILPGNSFNNPVSTTTVPFDINAGNFSLHRASGKVAVSPLSAGANVTLLDLDVNAGTVAYDTVVLNTGNNDAGQYSIYDTEWSNDGNWLYVSRTGDGVNPGSVRRFDLSQPQLSAELVNPAGLMGRSYGLKKGPDGNIYHLYQETAGVGNPYLLGRIENVDSAMTALVYDPQVFGSMNYNARQFPEFSPPSSINFDAIGFDFFGTCERTTTKFFPSVDPQATSYSWDFGDGTMEVYNDFVAPIHEYQTPGSYQVTLTATIDGRDTTFTQSVDIIALTDSVNLGADTVICPGETLELDAGPNGITYTWSDPEVTGQTMTVDSAGTYWVVVDYGTCESYDEINVEVYGEQAQFANIWYFGDGAGIDFNEQPPVPLTDGATQAPAGVSAYSDANGDIVLYSDGTTIYSRDHNAVGNNIGGDNTSMQSSLILPLPDDPTIFYVFTTEDVWGATQKEHTLRYSIYDMKKLGDPAGPVVLTNKTLYYRTTERLAGLIGANTWLLSHEFGTNTFRSYPITMDGIGNPVFSSVGSVHGTSSNETAEGYMQFDPAGQRVAVGLVTESGQNAVELFDFDQTTGELTNPIQITFDEPVSQNKVYGVEFSPGGNELFVTLTGSNSILYEFKLYNYTQDSIQNSGQIIAQGTQELGAIQAGPDGQLYIASEGQGHVIQFAPVQDTTQYSVVDLTSNTFDLAGGTSHLGLPNFAQNVSQQSGGPAMAVSDGCLGTPSSFIGTPSSSIDELFWDYVEGSSSETEFEHTFSAAGTYTIELNVTNRCGLDTLLTQDITINEGPNEPTLPAVDVICNGDLILNADSTNTPGLSFFWSTGDTTRTIAVNTPTDYNVTITDQNGCTSADTVSVYDGRPAVNLPPDFTVCQDETVDPLDAGNPASGSTYAWTINGANSGSGRFMNVDTSTPGVFNYRVEVTSGLTGCTGIDSVIVTINPLPATQTLDITNPTCGNSDGSIEITGSLNGLSYEWFDNTGASLGSVDPLDMIASGAYTLALTDNITGCTRNQPVSLVDDPVTFTLNATPVNDCAGNMIDVTTDIVTPGTISYTLTNSISGIVVENGTPGTANFDISPVSSGSYILAVSGDGCTDTVNVNISPNPTVDLNVDPLFDLCEGTNMTLTATSSSTNVEWFNSGGSLIGTGLNPDVSGTLPVGTHTITVIARGTNPPCDSTMTTTVNVRNSPEAEIIADNAGCDGEATLQANVTNGSGSYTYQWSNNDITRVINVMTGGDYSVDVTDQATGCPASAGPVPVTIYEEVMVTIEQDTVACEEGNLVTLAAISTPGDDGTYSYQWYQNGVVLQRDTLQNVETFSQGTFRVVVTNAGNCRSEATRSMARFPNTPADIEPSYLICPAAPVDFEGVEQSAIITPGNFTTYYAYNADTGAEIFEIDGTYEITEEGDYNFELGNAFNCFTFDSTMVVESCEPSIVAPTAFSPNASIDVNQTFRLFPLFVGEFEIFIFNRWGELIFHSEDLDFMENEGWDGTKNGQVLPGGTYAYVIKFRSATDPERGVIEQRGGVNLLR